MMVMVSRWVALDFEMTGYKAVEGRSVVEISAVAVTLGGDGGLIREVASWRVDPACPMNPVATGIHGIREEDLREAPYFREIAAEVLGFVGSGTLVLHGSSGDLAALGQELAAAGQDLPRFDIRDTEALARGCWPGQRSRLPIVAERLGVPVRKRRKLRRQTDGRSALTGVYERKSLADALMTMDIWLVMCGFNAIEAS